MWGLLALDPTHIRYSANAYYVGTVTKPPSTLTSQPQRSLTPVSADSEHPQPLPDAGGSWPPGARCSGLGSPHSPGNPVCPDHTRCEEERRRRHRPPWRGDHLALGTRSVQETFENSL